MALTRKFLSALGIESDKVDQIIEAHAETVDALKEQSKQYKADAEKYKADADKLPDLQKELETAKADAAYKEKYEKEHSDFEAYKTDISEKETKAKKEAAYKALLKDAGISDKHLNTVLKASDISGIELDEEGKIKDADKATEAIKTEWSDLITTTQKHGADTKTPPEGGDDSHHGTGRAKKIAEQYMANHYGVTSNNNE